MEQNDLPRWSLAAIYPSFDSAEYRRDRELLKGRIAALTRLLEAPLPETAPAAGPALKGLLSAWEAAGDLAENLAAYAEAIYTTDTRDGRALQEINAIDEAALPLGKAAVIFRNRLAERRGLVLAMTAEGAELAPWRFFLTEALEKAAFQMGPELEDLANDLARSGGDAWSRLQEAVTSTASALWDPATGERKTLIALRDLAHSPDRALRERAWKAELEACRGAEIPLAAALNGVKGTAITLDRRRGWGGGGGASPGAGTEAGSARTGSAAPAALRKSAFQSRMSEGTLAALIAALESSLPLFRRYLKAKAGALGLRACAFYDLFAPLGRPGGEASSGGEGAGGTWGWNAAAAFIAERFDAFDPDMGAFARRAFAGSWLDAQGREGKIGGAYCVSFPLAGESRILCNFEGSFDSVTTVAHELGHAWHHEVLKDLPRSRASYPMTLAETASIFAETIVFEDALAKAGAGERRALIEGNLKDSCQVIVDILSRFYFERALFEGRERAELSPAELCEIMREAQVKTYGEGLDPDSLHPYMWAVKSHYYRSGLGFYNYPYAFGLLFSLGLYERARREGPAFAAAYRKILRLTGQAGAEEVARSAGFNIEGPEFWAQGLGVIARRVEEFEGLAAGGARG